MTPEARWALIDLARQQTTWPSISWLRLHVAEHASGRNETQYIAWAQSIKRRPGTQVYALVHPLHGTEALAFIDPKERVLVWFDLERNANLSCFYLDLPLPDYLAERSDTQWRLPDTELT